MSGRWLILALSVLAVATLSAGSGCEALHNAGVPGMEPYVKEDPEAVAEARSHRENFALHRDHKSLYWLLSHKISNGMDLSAVEDALGEPGEYTTEFSRLKSEGLHQTTDPAYRWGPDNQGFSAVIFFRDGRVMNFDRKDFKTP